MIGVNLYATWYKKIVFCIHVCVVSTRHGLAWLRGSNAWRSSMKSFSSAGLNDNGQGLRTRLRKSCTQYHDIVWMIFHGVKKVLSCFCGHFVVIMHGDVVFFNLFCWLFHCWLMGYGFIGFSVLICFFVFYLLLFCHRLFLLFLFCLFCNLI